MLVLGIETATRAASVALVRAGAEPDEGRVLAERSFGETGASGAEILPALDACLEAAGATANAIEAIAVSIGPGSFTGLRVGLATAQGLALGSGAALVGVSTLDALAAAAVADRGPARSSGLLCACLDARRGEVYAALYRPSTSGQGVERVTQDGAYTPAELLELLRASRDSTRGVGRIVFVGDGAERYRAEILAPLAGTAESLSFAASPPRAAAVARLGHARLCTHGPDEPGAVVPRYARASEAEIKRRRALADPQH